MPAYTETVPDLAIVGCGAIAENFYLRALRDYSTSRTDVFFIDPNRSRAQALSEQLGAGRVAIDHREVVDEVEAAIVAVPPRLHHPVASDFLTAGVDVLCEKPLAEDGEEAADLVQTADESGTVLAVNNTRRLFPSYRRAREMVADGAIGELRRVEYHEGGEFNWPAASSSYFEGKRGVLMDRGAHVLDLVCWWMGGRPDLVSYRDDSRGGTEAVAHLILDGNGVEGDVWLSWLTKRSNRYRIVGTAGAIVGDVYDRNVFTLIEGDGGERRIRSEGEAASFDDLAFPLLDAFLKSVVGDGRPVVSGADVLPSIELMDECYRKRSSFELPWEDDLREVAREYC